MGQVFRIGNYCLTFPCSCCSLDNKAVEKGSKLTPPLHDGCDCYLVEDRNDKEAYMQSVDEGKARLIAKRIAAKMASDPMLLWNDMSPEQRDGFVHEWTKIVSEVLGEEVEPIDPLRAIDDLCKQIGHENVMNRASLEWMVNEKGSRIVGARRSDLVSCGCGGDPDCGWCCGVDQVTHRVKQAMEEADRPKVETESHERRGVDPQVWNQFIFHAGWTENFIDRMRERGAVKVEVPVSPTGAIAVEFPKLSEVTSGALRLTQDERDMMIRELDSMRDEKKPETGT